MGCTRTKFLVLVTLIVMILVSTTNNELIAAETLVQRGEFLHPANTPSDPERLFIISDHTQSFNFTLDSGEHMIVESEYSATHIEQTFTYKVSFSVSGGSLEFFLCSSSDARTWELGGTIFLISTNHWGSTTGVTARRTLNSYTSQSFVFNHEGSGSRTVIGSIIVDTSGPSISCSLVDNATYNETVTITASAVDTVSDIDELRLFIDNQQKKYTSSGSLSYNWDTSEYSNGEYTVKVTAVDELGYLSQKVYSVWVTNSRLDLGLVGAAAVGLVAVIGLYALISLWSKRRKKPATMSTPVFEIS
ncbi:MAG: Ig-like domain-containing protein [Candidatus Thorarchaeota archaeon]